MMKIPQGFKMLAESTHYLLGHIYEDGFMIKKGWPKELINIGSCYGDPDFGLIDENEQWALLMGHESYLWMPEKILNLNEITLQHKHLFKWPFDARQVADFGVEILDDPWSEEAAVYYLDIKTSTIKRIRDFKKLGTPYEEDKRRVDW